jgi:transposase
VIPCETITIWHLDAGAGVVHPIIFDGLIEDCRQVDVRSCPENAEPGPSQKFLQTPVIQAPRLGARIMRYELADYEWTAIRPMLPNKPRGVPRVNDRRVLNGIFWVLRSGAPWRDLPEKFGPYTTCYNRFVRWRRDVWGRIVDALAAAHDGAVQMIDTSIVRVHQHGACVTRNQRQSMGRSRGGLTSKIHALVDSNGLPVKLALSAGEAHDVRLAEKLLSRLKLAMKKGAWANIPPKSNRSDLLQPVPLSCSQSGRTVLQQDQTMSPGGDALTTNSRLLSPGGEARNLRAGAA